MAGVSILVSLSHVKFLIFEIWVALIYSDTLQSVKIESVKIKSVKFFIDFLDELGNFKQKKILHF